jgi:holo-[acyl-carrier protein] synthase
VYGNTASWPTLRLGVDLQRVGDVVSAAILFKERYLARVFTARELRDSGLPDDTVQAWAPRLAARFAGKEAVMKVLRHDDAALPWHDVEIRTGAEGAPGVILTGHAASLAEDQRLSGFTISLSHDGDYAIASAAAYEWEARPGAAVSFEGGRHD